VARGGLIIKRGLGIPKHGILQTCSRYRAADLFISLISTIFSTQDWWRIGNAYRWKWWVSSFSSFVTMCIYHSKMCALFHHQHHIPTISFIWIVQFLRPTSATYLAMALYLSGRQEKYLWRQRFARFLRLARQSHCMHFIFA
jgi:hypothetical protein